MVNSECAVGAVNAPPATYTAVMSGIAITEGMMYAIMRTLKYAWLALLLVPGLTITQASVVRAATLSNSQEPGSVLVFPYFQVGTVNVGNVDEPKTEIHIGVTCPTG